MKFPPPLALTLLALPLLCVVGCNRRPAPPADQKQAAGDKRTPGERARESPPGLPDFAVEAVSTQEGEAVWYDVPDQSLPERRAWSGELTAASDTLPLDTYARVRRIDRGDNGQSVVVRITDKGIRRRNTLIDLSREAAETLGMVKKGAVRVRVEALALKNANADKPVEKKDATPTAAKITSTPAATKEQEMNAAAKGN